MANLDGAFGLRPIRHLTGGCIRLAEYSIASGLAEDIFTGDLVKMTGTGTNVALAAAASTNGIGVFVGCRYVNSQGKQVFSPSWPTGTAGTDIVANICDDPNVVMQAQSTTIAAADVGTLVDLDDVAGSHVNGRSGQSIDGTSYGSGATFKVMGIVKSPDNAYGAYANVEVVFAGHALKGATSAVGN